MLTSLFLINNYSSHFFIAIKGIIIPRSQSLSSRGGTRFLVFFFFFFLFLGRGELYKKIGGAKNMILREKFKNK
jgi:hypothetical protein